MRMLQIRILESFVVLYVVALFFTNGVIYLSLPNVYSLPPYYFVLILFALLLPLIGLGSVNFAFVRTRVFWWFMCFMFLTTAWMLLMPHGDWHIYRLRIQSFVLALGLLLLFCRNPANIEMARKLIVFAVLLAVINNVLNLIYPHFFKTVAQYVGTGRSAGFYANPNEAGAAIIYGLILCLDVVPKRWRTPFLAATFLGVLLTLSRGAILGWFIVVMLMIWKRNLTIRSAGLALLGIAALALLIWPVVQTVLVHHASAYFDVSKRIQWLVSGGQVASASETQRLLVLKAGWDLFLEHPWLGSGIGATFTWNLPVSTHNMYLLFLTAYGIIGLPLYVAYAIVPSIGARGATRRIAIPFSAFLLYWGFFDHNVLDNFYAVFAVVLMAAMTQQSGVRYGKTQARLSASAENQRHYRHPIATGMPLPSKDGQVGRGT